MIGGWRMAGQARRTTTRSVIIHEGHEVPRIGVEHSREAAHEPSREVMPEQRRNSAKAVQQHSCEARKSKPWESVSQRLKPRRGRKNLFNLFVSAPTLSRTSTKHKPNDKGAATILRGHPETPGEKCSCKQTSASAAPRHSEY